MQRWVEGARPRTLGAAVVPVLVGSAAAAGVGEVRPLRLVLALIVALGVQVGTNYVNDAADGARGTDDQRVGPTRLVASGLATESEVWRAAIVAFAVAVLAGLGLTLAVGPELIPVGLACVAAGWLYTGGPRPYGYAGLGEAFVFVFFGLVATIGSAYVQLDRVTGLAVLASLPVGLWATALLVTNNLRDIPTDAVSGKRTLAVRLGPARTRKLFLRMMAGSFVLVLPIVVARPMALLTLAAVVLARAPVAAVAGGAVGPALIPVLQQTAAVQAVGGVLLAAGLWLSA